MPQELLFAPDTTLVIVALAFQPLIYFVGMGLLEWKLNVDLKTCGHMIIFH